MNHFLLFKSIAMSIFLFGNLYSIRIKTSSNTQNHVKQVIILNSIPKCGTHLAMKCIESLTGKTTQTIRWNPDASPNQFFFTGDDVVPLNKILSKMHTDRFISAHLTYSNLFEDEIIKNKYKFIFLYRDPRAQVVSMARWKIKYEANQGMNLDDCITSLISSGKLYKIGWANVESVFDLYKAFMPWVNNPKFLVIRFEDLVGPQGGGNAKKQEQTIKDIANYLNINSNSIKIKTIASDLFGGTTTFNEGQVDGWKEYFSDAHKEAFKKYAGQLLIDLGYEKDLNW